jgi:hypothetical protein
VDLADLPLSRRVVRILAGAGIEDDGALLKRNERELLGIPGFGLRCLTELIEALEATGLSLAEDEFAPYVCARHGTPAWDTNLADLFLCDDCARKWRDEAFAGADPEYMGEALGGYCVSCNELKEVRLRQWLLCGNCERVARSIGRGVAAERYLGQQWEELGIADHLELRQTDEPTLRGRRRDNAAVKVAAIDFVVRDPQAENDVLGFELKTGKKHLGGRGDPGGKMSEFQLDTTDCDDITTVMQRAGYPVYLVHVQVIDRAHPPTALYVPLGAWWTDPFRMADGFKRIQQRSRETRDAAYFDTPIFERFETFAEHIRSGEAQRLAERLHEVGIPPLYRR